MAGLGAALPPHTDALGQLLFEYSKRVYTSQLQHLKVCLLLDLLRMTYKGIPHKFLTTGRNLMYLVTELRLERRYPYKPCSSHSSYNNNNNDLNKLCPASFDFFYGMKYF